MVLVGGENSAPTDDECAYFDQISRDSSREKEFW